MLAMPSPVRSPAIAVLGVALAGCSGGGDSSSPIGANVPPDLLACRARIDSPFQFAEIALRDARNLGTGRVSDRTGTERAVRLHADGVTVAFARERDNNDPLSREIFVSTIDGSRGELRLTNNDVPDDEPCWSPDGLRILFTAERNAVRGLWLIDGDDGGNETPFALTPAGSSDGEADWSAATDRVVWSRKGLDGRHTLWLANGNGTAAFELTDGGPTTGDGTGDRAPAFSPDGQSIVFVRRIGAEIASLCLCDMLTGNVTTRLLPNGDVAWPRFAPAQDRLFFGLAEPSLGRGTLRLATVPLLTGEAVLLWPDNRWRLEGLDLLPVLPAAPVAGAAVPLDVLGAQLQLSAGAGVSGGRAQLVAEDGDEVAVLTANFEGREIAGINCRFDLPVLLATSVLELQVRVVARSTRADGDSVLRLSIYNPLDERFDTAVELPAATATRVLTFATSSLRHVTQERQLRVNVIGDLAPGPQAELRIDRVEVVLIPRQP